MDNINLMLWNDIINEDVKEAVAELAIGRDVLPKANAFQLSEKKFVQLFRLDKDLCREVNDMVTPFLTQPTRTSALSIQTKGFAALRFYASGSYQEITGSYSFVSISPSSTSRAVKEVTNALNQPEILNNVIRIPRNIEELQTIRTRVYENFQFPRVIGCIDCTHVSIVSPPADDEHVPEQVFVNRKNYHSLNVQLVSILKKKIKNTCTLYAPDIMSYIWGYWKPLDLPLDIYGQSLFCSVSHIPTGRKKVCDNNLKILNVNSRFPGSTHDAHIWRESAVSNLMEQLYRRDPANIFFLLGDSGYPTRPWLLTPILNPQNVGQQQYNDRLCSIRSTIERCNGVLKNRFRCLLRYRTLNYHPTTAGKIVNACCVLHNLCVERNIPRA